MRNLIGRVEMARELARQAMLHCAKEGVSLRGWRDDARMCCTLCGVPQPDDYLAWVLDGHMSDADVDACEGWDQAFTMALPSKL